MTNAPSETILIIEDDRIIMQSYSEFLQDLGYKTLCAADGKSGVDLFDRELIDLIIVDLLMPVMSGLEVLSEINRKSPDIPIIIISGKGTFSDAVIALRAGAWDYLVKPITDLSILTYTVENALEKALLLKKNKQYQKHLEHLVMEQTKILSRQKENIKRAQDLHRLIITKQLPLCSIFNIEASYIPSEEIGGDLLHIAETAEGNIIIILADCTGHGLGASMHTTMIKILCDKHMNILESANNTSNFLNAVNEDVEQYVSDGMFPIMFVCILNKFENSLIYSSANGELPYLVHNGNAEKIPDVKGFHLGYSQNTVFEMKKIKLQEDDCLIFYSDALIETPGVPWSRENDTPLRAVFSKCFGNKNYRLGSLLKSMFKNSNSPKLNDDFVLVYLEHKTQRKEKIPLSESPEIESISDQLKEYLTEYNYNDIQIRKIMKSLSEILKKSRGKSILYYTIDFEKLEVSVKPRKIFNSGKCNRISNKNCFTEFREVPEIVKNLEDF